MNGRAHGAISILNATATGHGCSLAIRDGVTAKWDWGGVGLDWQGTTDDRLAQACLGVAQARTGRADGATVSTSSIWPPSRGLKTSSAAAAAMLRAAGLDDIEEAAIDAARDAGVTLTGAFDDQVAVSRGGCHLTDNAARRVLQVLAVPEWHVAIWVPEARIEKSQIKDLDAGAARSGALAAEAQLRKGDVPGALRRNGRTFHDLYAAAGLPVDDAAVDVAHEAGALAAGLSGTGPAVAALFEAPVELPAVSGGSWAWSQVVP